MTKKGTLLTVVEWILHSLTVLVCCCFLLTCLIPFISPDLFNWVGFAGLACPFLATLLFFVALLWLFAKPMWALVIVMVLGIGYQQIEVMFGFHLNSDGFSESKNKKIQYLFQRRLQ
jgi:hypothetical protein